MKASKTINPLHFEDLEPHRFEDLTRQLAYGYKQWHRLEDRGKLGGDGGKDILGIERHLLEERTSLSTDENQEDDTDNSEMVFEEREWRIQCKRHKSLAPKQIVEIVQDLVPDKSKPPFGIIIAAACNISDKTFAAFHQERLNLGISEGHIWTKSQIEDFLFLPENDHLLFAYFGISLSAKRSSELIKIKRNISMKRKVKRAAEYQIKNRGDVCFLIRDIKDKSYFSKEAYKSNKKKLYTPWHPTLFEHDSPDGPILLYPKGILVQVQSYSGWIKEDGSWDIMEETGRSLARSYCEGNFAASGDEDYYISLRKEIELYEKRVPENEQHSIELLKLLPYASILEIDLDGDFFYECPHLFCDYKNGTDPYAPEEYFIAKNSWNEKQLNISDRRNFFSNAK